MKWSRDTTVRNPNALSFPEGFDLGRVRFAMARSGTQIGVTQTVQQVIDLSQGPSHLEFLGQDALDVVAPQRADLIIGPRSGFNPLANNGFLLRRKGAAWLATLQPLQLPTASDP